MEKVYISGKITGLPISQAQHLFTAAEGYLTGQGFHPVNPMREIPFNKDWNWEQYMLADIALIFGCTHMFMLSNWKDSKGARIENAIATEMQMTILYQEIEIICPYCYGSGTWECECCSGAGGCSCGGQPVYMGTCNVCKGSGKVIEGEFDGMANGKAIQGYGFIGSGPTDGTWQDIPSLGK